MIILINGYSIDFPYEPYSLQINYMESVLKALDSRRHAILESPTGTGKTLCLLCAVLAWQNVNNSRIANEDQHIKIFYLSRTHSQLKQVVKELKKIAYKPAMTIVGSRDHFCVDAEVKSIEKGFFKKQKCLVKISQNKCLYYRNFKTSKTIPHDLIFDVEDIVEAGRSCSTCPFFYVKSLSEKSQLILMPYNYLISPRIRKTEHIEIKNSIVIIDEVHNIDKVCEDTLSCQLRLSHIKSSVSELDSLLDYVDADKIDSVSSRNQKSSNTASLESGKVLLLIGSLTKLSLKIEEHSKEREKQLLTLSNANQFLLESGFSAITDEDIENILLEYNIYMTKRNLTKALINEVSEFILNLRTCVRVSNSTSVKYFRIVIERLEQKYQDVSLKLYCFSPQIAIQNLISEKVSSLIFTSGTLSPLQAFEDEIGLSNCITLVNSHIVPKENTNLFILNTGYDGKTKLLSTYSNRENTQYLSCLGHTICQIISQVIGGVIAFFPSYTHLDLTLKYWNKTGLFKTMSSLKFIVVEKTDKKEFEKNTNYFIQNHKKCIYLCVCRGKLSEGFDFADDYCRAVIIIGIPYPPKNDEKVLHKMMILKENLKNDQDWYTNQAYKSVNQAVGRVIRHKDDYGLIFLLDERFKNKPILSSLPSWLNKPEDINLNFSTLLFKISNFFDRHIKIGVQFEDNIGASINYKRKESVTDGNSNVFSFYSKSKKVESKENLSVFSQLYSKPRPLVTSKFQLKDFEKKDLTESSDDNINKIIDCLKRYILPSDVKTLGKVFKLYKKDCSIDDLMRVVSGIVPVDHIHAIESLILDEHKLCFMAHVELLKCKPLPLENVIDSTSLKCNICRRVSPTYQLKCSHYYCDNCLCNAGFKGQICLICKTKISYENLKPISNVKD